MNKNILILSEMIFKSKKKVILIWNGLLPTKEDVEILQSLTIESGKIIKVVPLVTIVENIDNKNVDIFDKNIDTK